MKKNLLYLILFCSQFLLATPEQPDLLKYNGKTYEWTGYGYGYKYIKNTNLPVPKEALNAIGNSDNQILIYKIEKGKLYFVDVQIYVEGKILYTDPEDREIQVKSIFSHYFPDNKPIFIADASEVIEITDGKVIGEDEYCYLDTYEIYLVIHLKSGRVKYIEHKDYNGLLELRHNAFAKLKKTPDYKRIVDEKRENLIFFNTQTCNTATIEQYIEYFIFKQALSKGM